MIRPMHHAIFYWIALGVLVLLGSILVVINIWLFWPYKTLEIVGYSDQKPLKVQNAVIYPGKPIEYELNYCKYTSLSSVVRRTMVDGQVITLLDTPGRLPKGCHKALVKTAVVPETINPGRYYLDVLIDYRVNPIRTETVHYRTEYFEVVRGTGSGYEEIPQKGVELLPEGS